MCKSRFGLKKLIFSLMVKHTAHNRRNTSSNLVKSKYNYIIYKMPQFDFATFFVQAFSFSLAFGIFYLVYVKLVLSEIFTTLRFREKLLLLQTQTSRPILPNAIINKIFSKI